MHGDQGTTRSHGAGKELARAFVTGKLGDDTLEGSLDGHNQLGDLLTEEQGCHFLGELLVDNPTFKGHERSF